MATVEDTDARIVLEPAPLPASSDGDYPWPSGWSRRVTPDPTFSNRTVCWPCLARLTAQVVTGVGLDATATLRFIGASSVVIAAADTIEGTGVEFYSSTGFIRCANITVSIDGASSGIACHPGPQHEAKYNVRVWSSGVLSLGEHTVQVRADPVGYIETSAHAPFNPVLIVQTPSMSIASLS